MLRYCFCSDKCAHDALKLFHLAVCGRSYPNFQFLINNNPELDCDSLSRLYHLLRFLATIVQNPSPNPLGVSIINQLTAPYGGDYLAPFDFEEAVLISTAVLQDLGIDVFANQAYNTWIIQTIMARIHNNRSGDDDEYGSWHAIHFLFAFFNHSCRPNVEWHNWIDDRANMMRVTATKDVLTGEQLTISYDGDCDGLTLRERNKYLEHWMPFGCQCWFCEKERAADKELETRRRTDEDEIKDDVDTFDMSKGTPVVD
jgi:hypothetical protein